jgi:thermostable 8-oxoguanine DNA glycosylase
VGLLSQAGKDNAERRISSVDKQLVKTYDAYWDTIKPITPRDKYHRWLFAVLSVHTKAEDNVALFELMRDIPKFIYRPTIRQMFMHYGHGFYNTRTENIYRLNRDFWQQPEIFRKKAFESTYAYRERMAKSVFGLGLAKAAFAIEMLYPRTCEVVCCDTHVKQCYGVPAKASVSDKLYREMESHWLDRCQHHNLPCTMVRHIYWDSLRGQPNTRYWSHVFEK